MAFTPRRLMRGASAAREKDPYFNYVTMLLHGDGTNGAQNNTFLDSSTNNFTITRNGNTTQGSFSPYGSNWSNNFNGSSYLTGPTTNSAFDFGSGDWTIETWAFPTAFSNQMAVFISLDNATSNSYAIGLLINTNGSVQVYQYGGSYFINSTSSTGVVTLNTWSHIAAVRSGSTFAIFVNGTRVASVSGVSGTQDANKTVNIGQDPYANNLRFSGYLSNLRVVKGTAVYSPSSSTITVPTTPLTAISGTSLLTCADNRFLDDSTNNFAITANGTMSVQRFNPFGTSTAYSTSVIGGSGYFDGSGDYLVSPASSSYQFAGDFTIEYWANLSVIDGVMPIGQTYTGNNFQIYYSADGSIEFGGSNLGLVSTSAGVIVKNSWHHGALVRSGSTVTLYINGVSRGTITSSATVGNNATIGIGARPNNAYNCTGYISNVRLVSSAVYTTTFTPPTTPFTAISGTVLLLSTTNAAIFDNAMMQDFETVGNAQISTSVKKFGTGSMYFDGTGDYLVIPSAPANQMGSSPFAIEMWIYPTTISGTHSLIGKYIGGNVNASEYWLWITSTGKLAFAIDGDGGENYVESGAGAIVVNTWTHVAAIRTAGAIAIYINGTQANSAGIAANYLSVNTTPLNIGAYNSGLGTYFGYIDDLRITKGLARYSGGSFTVPARTFSDTGPY